MTQHYLKIRPEYHDAILNGIKTHEIRKNDRNFRVGDSIKFDVIKEGGKIHHAPERYTITHILTSEEFPDGIKEGYAILSIKRVEE